MTSKQLWFSRHVAQYLFDRGLRRRDVRWILAKGLPFPPDQHRGSEWRVGREATIRGTRYRVVYVERATVILIVSVHKVLTPHKVKKMKTKQRKKGGNP